MLAVIVTVAEELLLAVARTLLPKSVLQRLMAAARFDARLVVLLSVTYVPLVAEPQAGPVPFEPALAAAQEKALVLTVPPPESVVKVPGVFSVTTTWVVEPPLLPLP